MLTSLQIRDLAIIDAIELELKAGLTVLTGETGAGKSILVDALQLLAGGRAGAEIVRHGSERAEVSATFDVAQASPELARWLQEQSLNGEELVVRRVVGADGRSRAYLNGQAVPVQLLREAGALLIDIHGQHEFQSLTRAAPQRERLDAFARHEALVQEVAAVYEAWQALHERAVELEGHARDRETRLELLRFQLHELESLNLKEGEVTALSEERMRLTHRGRLAEGVQRSLEQLYETDSCAHAAVSRAGQALRALAGLDPKLAPVLPLIDEAQIQIREAARELEHYREALDMDPARQEEVERRLAALEELARKHRVPPEQLLERTVGLTGELAALERADLDLATVRTELARALERYQGLAEQLSASRVRAGESMAQDITARMHTLGMAGGRFEVGLTTGRSSEPTLHGNDQIELRVTANPGQPPRAVSKVASGGELSRLSLAVQVSCAVSEARCMVFDEVDSGIGGGVAEIVGRELRTLSERGQVLCVTHLPQVASQGHHHLRVVKLTDGHTTRTALAELSEAERVEELARMLGGLTVTEKAREHAREMLASAGQSTSPPRRRAAAGEGSARAARAAKPR
jgi:DNA repair protein RecN (Recombination protein N)